MTNKNKPGIGFQMNIRGAGTENSGPRLVPREDAPFNMMVLADLSGCSMVDRGDSHEPLAKRRIIAIDRDNFDEVIARVHPSIASSFVPESDEQVVIRIRELDDFHPDALFDSLDVFSHLRSVRRRLQNNASFDEAAAEIMGWLLQPELDFLDHEHAGDAERANSVEQNDGLLDSVLDSTQESATDLDSVLQPGGIDRLARAIIAPYVEPAANPRQQDMIDAVDEAIAGHMRQILHHPDFQRLEATWRSIDFLVHRVDSGRNLKIFLLDVSRDELASDLAAEMSESALHKHFCDPAENDSPWSLIVGDYYFEDRIEDVLLLSQLGEIARIAKAPFVAGARETLCGCDSFATSADPGDWRHELKPGFEQAWKMLRESEVAAYVGLALPRFLVRAPYGRKSSPIDAFTFEEMAALEIEQHHAFLWGNAAFIKAEQLARAFNSNGWELSPETQGRCEDLPLGFFDDDGELAALPCAEIYLTESGAKRLSGCGLISLWSVKNQNAIVSTDFRSLAMPTMPLKGRWVSD